LRAGHHWKEARRKKWDVKQSGCIGQPGGSQALAEVSSFALKQKKRTTATLSDRMGKGS